MIVKSIDVSEPVYAALEQLAAESHRTPDEVLASLLDLPAAGAATDPLSDYLLGAEFRTNVPDADKYLALLAWVAGHHPTEFAEFIRHAASGRHYLGMTREEVLEACRHHQARQIDGTPYWAIMNLDPTTKRRFLARVLTFIGYDEPRIAAACAALGASRPSQPRRRRLLGSSPG